MIASFHVVEYQRRAFVPPKRLAQEVDGLRFWRPLNIGGDFGWFREHPSRWGLYRRMKPDFRRWAFIGVWDDESAVDVFLSDSPTGEAWADAAAEAWHVWLQPVHVTGPWEAMRALEGSEDRGARRDGPAVFIVRLDLSLRGTLAMWGSAAPSLLPHLAGGDDMLLGIPLVDRPYVQPVSFSVWRSDDAAMQWVHREGGHERALGRVKGSQRSLVERHSSAQFHPIRAQGTWQGRNPLERATFEDAGRVTK